MPDHAFFNMYCKDCDNRFKITYAEVDRFLEDMNVFVECPNCKSQTVNTIEVDKFGITAKKKVSTKAKEKAQ